MRVSDDLYEEGFSGFSFSYIQRIHHLVIKNKLILLLLGTTILAVYVSFFQNYILNNGLN